MPTVWLIRHTESISNANMRTEHPVQSELTAQGFAAAQHLPGVFTQAPDLFVVSSYVRAKQTAVPTLERFPTVPQEEWPVHEFTYLDTNHYRGTTGSERAPVAQAYWQRNDPLHNEGDGESFADLVHRVQGIITRLRQHPASFIAIFSHGLFLRALVWYVLAEGPAVTAASMRRYSRFVRAVKAPNGSICRAQFPSSGPIYLSGFDTSHLPPE